MYAELTSMSLACSDAKRCHVDLPSLRVRRDAVDATGTATRDATDATRTRPSGSRFIWICSGQDATDATDATDVTIVDLLRWDEDVLNVSERMIWERVSTSVVDGWSVMVIDGCDHSFMGVDVTQPKLSRKT